MPCLSGCKRPRDLAIFESETIALFCATLLPRLLLRKLRGTTDPGVSVKLHATSSALLRGLPGTTRIQPQHFSVPLIFSKHTTVQVLQWDGTRTKGRGAAGAKATRAARTRGRRLCWLPCRSSSRRIKRSSRISKAGIQKPLPSLHRQLRGHLQQLPAGGARNVTSRIQTAESNDAGNAKETLSRSLWRQ